MLNICCINASNYLGKGVEYANILANMVARNIGKETSYKFICFTDTPGEYDPEIDLRPLPEKGLEGWWNKLALFKEDLFPEGDRVLYIDLDTVIVSGLDDIIKYEGEFAILRDFYRSEGLQSSVMAWKANNKTKRLWSNWVGAGKPESIYGDQKWIELCLYGDSSFFYDKWQDILPDFFVSYKVRATNGIPKNSRMIIFHGEPRPHEVKAGWMPHVWKIDGGTTLELKHVCNTSDDQVGSNIRNALKLPFPWLQLTNEHNGHAVIIGGGPSLKGELEEIRKRQKEGQVLFATNNTYAFLRMLGIYADCHVMIDAREENKEFTPKEYTRWSGTGHLENPILYYASQCHPAIFEKAKNVILFHSFYSDGIFDIIGNNSGDPLIGGGCTVGLHAIALAWTLGYRKFHLYGFDSSYSQGENHAYKQSLNDTDKVIEVVMNDNKYQTAPWMATQVEHFRALAQELIEKGCVITIHGEGLLPDVARLMSTPDEADTEMVCKDGTWWPSKCIESRLNTEFTFDDIDMLISFCNKKKTAVQAGGNVGVWPREFSKHFDKVIAFEPDALNFECMVKNTDNIDNIEIYNTALGDKECSGALNRVSYNCGAHYIKDGNEFKVMTIDSLALDSCDLIQLDIEGFELNALKGAQKTIESFKPVIMVEDKGLSNRYGTQKGDIEKWLEPMGYVIQANTARDIIFKHI